MDAQASVIYTGTAQYANRGIPINSYLVGPNGVTVYNNTLPLGGATSSWSTSSWSISSWSTSTWASSGN